MPDLQEQAPTIQQAFDFLGDVPPEGVGRLMLAERFVVPPFTVLDTRQGYWQERRRAWLSLGIQSEIGRGQNVLDVSATMAGISDETERAEWNEQRRNSPRHSKGPARAFSTDLMRGEHEDYSASGPLLFPKCASYDFYEKKRRKEKELGREIPTDEFLRDYYETDKVQNMGVSIFDPVVCELVYSWFCPPKAVILDPFAGGSVRGIVAAYLGHQYLGIELSSPQVDANRGQAAAITPDNKPAWLCADSSLLDVLLTGFPAADFIFSCPPYYDLEVYSDHPRDISGFGTYGAFLEVYREVVRKSVGRLRDNRFACFVVSEIRDKRGFYRGFVPDTIRAFEDAGAAYYNEFVLVNVVGSMPVRVGNQFGQNRKAGRVHQNILVFYKGDVSAIRLDMGVL